MRKNIVYYVTLQYMRLNKKRTVTTFFGIFLMVLLMTCVFVGKDTVIGYLEQVASAQDGKWHVILYDISAEEQREAEGIEGVEDIGISAGYGFTEFAQSGNEARPYLNIKAYQAACFDFMNIHIKAGRLPENGSEAVISEAAVADGADIAIGDTIDAKYFRQNGNFEETKDYTGQEQEFTVVGIIETPGYEKQSAEAYTAITFLEGRTIGELAHYNMSVRLDLKKVQPLYADSFREIAGEHEIEFNDYVLAFSGKSSDSVTNTLVTFLTAFFVMLIMLVSVILIYNMFMLSFGERSRYLGMLSSVGATGRQRRSSVYFEASCLLLAALPSGIVSGLGIVWCGMMLIRPFLGDIMNFGRYVGLVDVSLAVSAETVAAIMVLCVITVLISAFLPARKVGRGSSVAYIRGNADNKKHHYKMDIPTAGRRNVEWLLARITLKRQRRKTGAITATTVTFMVVILVTAFGEASIEKLLKEKIADSFDQQMNAEQWDYLLSVSGLGREGYEDLKQEIEQAEGIEETAEWYSGNFVGNVDSDCYSKEYWDIIHEIYNIYYHRTIDNKEYNEMISGLDMPVSIIGVDQKTLQEIAKASGTDIASMEGSEPPGAIVLQNGILSTENSMVAGMKPERYFFSDVEHMTDKKEGDILPIKVYSEKEDRIVTFPIRVAGYAKDGQLKDFALFHSQYLWLIVSTDTAKKINETMQLSDGEGDLTPELYIRTSEKEPKILDKLRRLRTDEGYFFIRADYDVRLGDAITCIVRIVLFCFVALSSIICMLNLFNSICIRINGRAGEFAILKSVGMTGKQIERMLFYESIGIVCKSILYAALIAFLLIYLIKYVLTLLFGRISLPVPWVLIAVAVLAAASVVIMMTRFCYRKGKQDTILEQIRNG